MIHPIPLSQPTAPDARKARDAVGLTQREAAALVGLGSNCRWAEYESARRTIDPARFALFLLLTDQHSEYQITRKESK